MKVYHFIWIWIIIIGAIFTGAILKDINNQFKKNNKPDYYNVTWFTPDNHTIKWEKVKLHPVNQTSGALYLSRDGEDYRGSWLISPPYIAEKIEDSDEGK